MNRFTNDGSFMQQFKPKKITDNDVESCAGASSTGSSRPFAVTPAASVSRPTRITAKSAFGADDDDDDEPKPAVTQQAMVDKKPSDITSVVNSAARTVPQHRLQKSAEFNDAARKRSRWDVNEAASKPQSVYADKNDDAACNLADRSRAYPSRFAAGHSTPTAANSSFAGRPSDGGGRQRKRRAGEKLEYDSDEEVDPIYGTWEHKRRLEEMQRTAAQATPRLHRHIGDYIPPEELQKLLPRPPGQPSPAAAVATASSSNTAEKKIDDTNVGFKLLAKMGWKDGSGLGASSQGRQEPVAAVGDVSKIKVGLGTKAAEENAAESGEPVDEFELYRKRMMTAYKYRPNPLNNPRRSYY